MTDEQLKRGRLSEGDVVGFVGGAITKKTRGADIVGVVSRRAAVAGSAPPAAERWKYDTVAYTGRVPVKLHGSAMYGDVVGPSGLQDGTVSVVASSWIGNAFPCCYHSSQLTQQRVGVVVGFSPEGGGSGGQRLVEVAVSPPPMTRAVVNNRLNFFCVLMVFGLTSLLVEVMVLNAHLWRLGIALKLDMQAVYDVEDLNLTSSRLADQWMQIAHSRFPQHGTALKTRQEVEEAADRLQEMRHSHEWLWLLVVLLTWCFWLAVACL